MVEDGDFSHKIASKLYYLFKSYGDLAEWLELPIWGALAMEGQRSTGLPRLVSSLFEILPPVPQTISRGVLRTKFIYVSLNMLSHQSF